MDLDPKFLDAVVKSIGLLGAAFAWLYQTRAAALRSKIKTDLEILEKSRTLFGDGDSRTLNVDAKVTNLMGHLYRDISSQGSRRASYGDLAVGITFLVGAAFWLWYASNHKSTFGPVWQAAGAVGLVFVALGGFLNAFAKKTGRAVLPPAA